MEDRKAISLEELDRRIRHNGPNVAMSNVQVSGTVIIKDKDGNIKSTMEIVSLESQELEEHAIS